MTNLPLALYAALDSLCSKLDEGYRKWPILLKIQLFACLTAGFSFLGASAFMKYIFLHIWSGVKVVVGVIIIVYYLVAIYNSRRAHRPRVHHRTPAYVRTLVQWGMQHVVKYLSQMTEGKSHLADWFSTSGFFFLYCHLITFLKLKGSLQDFGAIDAFFSLSIAFADQLLQTPFTKLCATLCFGTVMAIREHRAALKEERKRQTLEWLAIMWILNMRISNRLGGSNNSSIDEPELSPSPLDPRYSGLRRRRPSAHSHGRSPPRDGQSIPPTIMGFPVMRFIKASSYYQS